MRNKLLLTIASLGLISATILKVTGIDYKEIFGGRNKIQIQENGNIKELEIPVFSLIGKVPPNRCSRYSRLVTKSMGNEIVGADAWELYQKNNFEVYNPEKLERGDIVVFQNPKSRFNSPERPGSHATCYIGVNFQGKRVYAEQRGFNTQITTEETLLSEGWKPVQRIIPKKDNKELQKD